MYPLMEFFLIIAPVQCKVVALTLHGHIYITFFFFLLKPSYKLKYVSSYNCFKGYPSRTLKMNSLRNCPPHDYSVICCITYSLFFSAT